MAEKNDGGDKTELPTPKKLQDARKKGDVAKSKDVSAALLTLAWLLLFTFSGGYVATEIAMFFKQSIDVATTVEFSESMPKLGGQAVWLLIKATAIIFIPIAVLATIAEYLQVGPVMTMEKMKPGLDKLNPVEGLKRMFGMDGLVEMIKSLIKVTIILVIMYIMIAAAYEQAAKFVLLAETSPVSGGGQQVGAAVANMTFDLTIQFFVMVTVVFLFIGVVDRLYSKHKFIKKMKMSMRDIRQEHKDNEGDPHIKAHRREMHQQWANQNAVGATGGAAALLVNPTHISIALDYDETDCPVPVIAARGQGPLAAAMREEAERAGVPIIRNVATARRLWARGEIGEIVPEDMFDAIAEIILWAKKAKAGDAPMWQDMDNEPKQINATVAEEVQ
jgi:type III secretion protein U